MPKTLSPYNQHDLNYILLTPWPQNRKENQAMQETGIMIPDVLEAETPALASFETFNDLNLDDLSECIKGASSSSSSSCFSSSCASSWSDPLIESSSSLELCSSKSLFPSMFCRFLGRPLRLTAVPSLSSVTYWHQNTYLNPKSSHDSKQEQKFTIGWYIYNKFSLMQLQGA